MELTSILLILMWLGIRVGLGMFFKKADHAFWKAFVPVYSTLIWLQIIKRPKWWVVLSFIPVVNLVLGIGMIVELLNVFGKRNPIEHVLAGIMGYIFLPYFATKVDGYVGTVDYKKEGGKPVVREWSEAIFFAVIAATIIRTFTIEAFQIPSSSMEKTLLTGDFLFVSKVHYGAKTPMTPLAFPFMHHSMPVGNLPAYLDWIELPYFRFPALQSIKRNDIVVFNYPRESYRPIDKREHYIKRCVAVAGDTLEVKMGLVHVNGNPQTLPETGQHNRMFKTQKLSEKKVEWMKSIDLNLKDVDYQFDGSIPGPYPMTISINEEDYKKLIKQPWIEAAEGNNYQYIPKGYPTGGIYPKQFGIEQANRFNKGKVIDSLYPVWNRDNYGPLYIPKEGESIELTPINFAKYETVLRDYEGVSLVGVKELISSYRFLENMTKKEFSFGKMGGKTILNDALYENTAQKYATKLKANVRSLELSEFFQHWADKFYMRTILTSEPNETKRKKIIKKEYNAFDAALKKFAKNEAKIEIEWILSKFKEFNPEWNSADAISSIENQINSNGNLYMINGEISKTYTFKQDYFFMMGDNRHASADSRDWGFVPHDHVVGKAVFVWLSMDPDYTWGQIGKKIRWKRLCSFVSSDGLSRSFAIEFLIAGLIIYFFNKRRKKKKEKAA